MQGAHRDRMQLPLFNRCIAGDGVLPTTVYGLPSPSRSPWRQDRHKEQAQLFRDRSPVAAQRDSSSVALRTAAALP